MTTQMQSTEDRITLLLQEAQAHLDQFNPEKFLNACRDLLRSACSKGGEWDVAGPNGLGSQGAYFTVADFLSGLRFTWATEQLLLGWWDDIGIRQLTERQILYTAGCGYKLAQLYIRQGDRGAATRWALLTQANDLLRRHLEGGGAGRQWLRSVLGMTEPEVDEFSDIASANLTIIEAENSDLQKRARFAEDLVVQLALKGLSFAHLFSAPTQVSEFPISQPYFQTLLQQVDALHETTKAKGDALEYLASYLFLLVPGLLPRRDLFDVNQGFESDLIVTNLSPASNLAGELLGRSFLVECKNWESESVGAPEVGYFLHRMRLTHCTFGIIFVRDDVSGSKSKGETAARSLIRRAFHEDGNTCIVLDRHDLDSLAKREMTFWSLLLAKIEEFRFGSAK